MVQYEIPQHCETAVIFEYVLMFVFEPIVVPFYYSAYKSDAEDFFVKYCLDCSLRGRSCHIAGAIANGSCKLRNCIQHEDTVESIPMPIPKHVLILWAGGDSPSFGYETASCIKALKLGNIGGSGGWCNGDVSFNSKDPSSVYNGYMQSIHNCDLTNQSSDTYPDYLKTVAEDFTKIQSGYTIDPENFGDILNVIHKPTSILWSGATTETGYYKQGRNQYVKIQ